MNRHPTRDHPHFDEYQFRRQVDQGLETVRRVLENTRCPTYAADSDHAYGDKYALSEFLANSALAAQINVLERMGVDAAKLARLTREEEAARATTRAAEAEAEAAASSGSKRAPYEDTDNVAQLERRFDEACCSIGRMFDDASCGTEPSGMHLATKGCSASTVHDFLSLLAARLDLIEADLRWGWRRREGWRRR